MVYKYKMVAKAFALSNAFALGGYNYVGLQYWIDCIRHVTFFQRAFISGRRMTLLCWRLILMPININMSASDLVLPLMVLII